MNQSTLDNKNCPPELAIEGKPRTPNVNNTLTNKQQMKMDRLGIGGSYVSSWKKGRLPSHGIYHLLFLSHHLKVTTWSKKMGASRVLIDKEDALIVTWILGMHHLSYQYI